MSFSRVVLVAMVALWSAACRDRSGSGSGASPTTVSSGAAQRQTSAVPDTGPVTEGDVVEVEDVLRRLDGELDRLDSDMAAGEGDPHQVGLEAAKATATGAITRRLLALRDLTTFLKGASRLSEADRTALTDHLQAQVNGLTTLNAKIQGTADPAVVRADAARIATDYRVYSLTIPKARSVLAADIAANAAERLTTLADRFGTTVNQARVKGKDVARAVTDLTSLRTSLVAVSDAVSPVPATLLALEPSGFPGNQPVLEQARLVLRTGRAGLADAARLARQMIADLE